MVGNTALAGMERTETVPSPSTLGNTLAPYVVTESTMHNPALPSSSLLPIVAPFVADTWELQLRQHNLFDTFSDVPYSIRHGFDLGIHSIPTITYIPPNHSSAIQHPQAILTYIRNELSCGRYTGPFSPGRLEKLIGPFRTSPLGVIPKPTPGEFRLVQDFSYPHNNDSRPSLNSEIDTSNLSCDWGTFQEIATIVMNAPEGTQAATLDVDAAFRRCPIKPSQQCNFVIHFDGLCYIDHVAPFGTASAGFAFRHVADAMMAILHAQNIGPAKNWVDDFVFFHSLCPPNHHAPNTSLTSPLYPYDIDSIDSIAQPLGWPWKHSKTKPFDSLFTYLGFLWDLIVKSVQITTKKKTKYMEKLKPWDRLNKFTRRETESILGTLAHCSLAIPEGCSRLPSISRFAASFTGARSSFIRKTPPNSVLGDVAWWREELKKDFCGSILSQPPSPSPIEFWVDASTNWGIGIVFDDHWDAIQLCNGWKSAGHNIGWAEFIAIELGLLCAISQGHQNTHFTIRSDNQGVIHAIQGGRSCSPEQNLVLQRILLLLSTNSLWISLLYVQSASNLADRPSRGLPAFNSSRFPTSLAIPPHLEPFFIAS